MRDPTLGNCQTRGLRSCSHASIRVGMRTGGLPLPSDALLTNNFVCQPCPDSYTPGLSSDFFRRFVVCLFEAALKMSTGWGWMTGWWGAGLAIVTLLLARSLNTAAAEGILRDIFFIPNQQRWDHREAPHPCILLRIQPPCSVALAQYKGFRVSMHSTPPFSLSGRPTCDPLSGQKPKPQRLKPGVPAPSRPLLLSYQHDITWHQEHCSQR